MPRENLIQYRRGTAAQWAAVDPILAGGEVGFATDTNEVRIGNGIAVWTSLDPIGGAVSEEQIGAAVAAYLADNPISTGFVHTQSVPLASWSFNHPIGRIPNISVYLSGVLVDPDISATTTTVSITFPSPAAGTAVLS